MTLSILLVLGAVGGLLPDVLRFIKDHKTGNVYKDPAKLISLGLQVGVGVFVVYLLMYIDLKNVEEVALSSTDAIKALGLGYAAPDILTNTIVAANKKRDPLESTDADEEEMAKPTNVGKRSILVDDELESFPGAGDKLTDDNKSKEKRSIIDWWTV